MKGNVLSECINVDFGIEASDDSRSSLDGQSSLCSYELRQYQEELFREAIHNNLIVCLPTNSGKTLIAISLIRAKLVETKGDYPQVARRTFFLAPTRCLVEQQFLVVKNLVPASSCFLTGDHKVDFFTLDQWNEYLRDNQVIVLTPIILVDIITRGLIKMENINLIVVDEAHWALKKNNRHSSHPYRMLMDLYSRQCTDMVPDRKPRILCLSASLLNSQIQLDEFDDTIKSIELIYQARASTRDISQFYHEAKIFVQHYHNLDNSTEWNIDFDFDRTLVKLQELDKESSLIKKFRKMLEKVRDILYYRMGPWCAAELINLYKNSLPNLSPEFANCFGALLNLVWDQIWDKFGSQVSPTDLALHKLSSKLSSLLKMLLVFHDELNCIIFVDERTDANILFRWLQHLSQHHSEYSFIKVGFICGVLNKGFVRFDDITKDFKKKSYDKQLNILVATSVLEEGIDVPHYNVVIRYDFPRTYRAFCQSKGRARYRNSFYILMVDQFQENLQWCKSLNKYYQIDQQLKQLKERHSLEVKQNLEEEEEEDDCSDGFGQIFQTQFGMLMERDSIRLLANYLARLPSDFFTENKANFIELTKKVSGSRDDEQSVIVSSTSDASPQQVDTVSTAGANLYCYVFVFPINSSISGIVKGEFRTNKRQAKNNCAFQVCKLLLERGEIDQHLNVIKSSFLLQKHATELNLKVEGARVTTSTSTTCKYNPSKAFYDCFKSTFFTGRIFSPTSKSLLSPSCSASADSSNRFYLYSIHFGCVNFDSDSQQQSGAVPCAPSDIPTASCQLHSQSKLTCELCPGQQQGSFIVGFLSPNKLPTLAIDSFIYHNLVCIKFKIKYNYEIRLSEEKMRQVDFFHNHVLGKMFWNRPSRKKHNTADSGQPKQLSEITNFFLLPLVRTLNTLSINFDLINQLIEWDKTYTNFSSRKKRFSIEPNCEMPSETDSPDALVDCFDESETLFSCFSQPKPVLYYFKDISSQYPDSLMQNSSSSFVDFYQQLGFSITRLHTPLIHAGRASTVAREFNIVAKQGRKAKVKKVGVDGEDSHLLFPYEFILKYPLDRSAYHTLSTVPALFYRLEQYLIAYQLMLRLSSELSSLQLDFDEISAESLFMVTKIVDAATKANEFTIIDIDRIDLKQNRVSEESRLSKVVSSIAPSAQFDQLFSTGSDQKSELIDQILESLRELVSSTKFCLRDQKLTQQLNQHPLQYSETSLLFFSGDITEFINIHLDSYDYVKCPHPWHIVKALTLAKSNDLWNMERLETVGDSFLKMSTALYVYHRFLNYDEGKLQKLKDAMVCNENLFKLALDKNLPRYIFGLPLVLFNLNQRRAVAEGAHLQSPPVAYSQDSSDEDTNSSSDSPSSSCQPPDSPKSGSAAGSALPPKESKQSRLPFKQELKDKDIADCVEALLGTFLIHGSAGTAVAYLSWLGLPSFDPNKMAGNEQITDPVNYYQRQLANNLKDLDDETIGMRLQLDLATLVQDSYRLSLLDEVESIVGYQFTQKYFLVQALTHPSFSTIEYTNQSNLITSYQRLEFIGDAILDYVMTHYIYLNDQSLSPFQITVLRSALVNNAFYASVVVKYNLHKYLRYSSHALARAIGNFVKKYKIQCFSQLLTLFNCATEELEAVHIDEIDIPKALADIFEALIGAIFVDNGYSLDHVWRIVYRMIKPEVDYLLKNIPIMPLARLEKEFPQKYNFSSVRSSGTRMEIELTIGQNSFTGYGQNKQQCKLSAAKRAFEHFDRSRPKV